MSSGTLFFSQCVACDLQVLHRQLARFIRGFCAAVGDGESDYGDVGIKSAAMGLFSNQGVMNLYYKVLYEGAFLDKKVLSATFYGSQGGGFSSTKLSILQFSSGLECELGWSRSNYLTAYIQSAFYLTAINH